MLGLPVHGAFGNTNKGGFMKIRILLLIAATFLFWNEACVADTVKLPAPDKESGLSVSSVINARKSSRRYSSQSLTLSETGQLLWSAGGATVDGITGPTRAYPSAGGVYPLEIYIVAGNVDGLEAGLYKYDWQSHSLEKVMDGDLRESLSAAAYGQRMLSTAPATIVITALYEKTEARYGERGRTLFVPMDAGHLGQNVHLQAESLGLGTVMVAGFDKEKAARVLSAAQGEPVYMMPVGKTTEE
jgi:SagB-type dehydrogenase family enzyme